MSADLNRTLAAEIAALRALLSGLESERAALLARDPEAVVQAAERKSEALRALDAGARERAGVALPPKDAAGARLWKELLALAERGDALNRENAQLLEAQRARTLWALRFLGASAPLYARDGQTGVGNTPSRLFERA